MRTLTHACGRLAVALALTFGLGFAWAGAPAFTGASVAFAEDAPLTALAANGQVKLTKLDDGSVLVELLNAHEVSTTSVGLEAQSANGASLAGCSFEFTPEAQALRVCHAVPNGNGLVLVVSNGRSMISADGNVFALGTLRLPEGAAKVTVTEHSTVNPSDAEALTLGADGTLGSLLLAKAPGTGDGTDTDPKPDPEEKPGQTTPPTTDGDGGPTSNTTKPDDVSKDPRPSIIRDTVPTSTVRTVTADGKNLAQTGDERTIDASAFLLMAGGAALLAAVLFRLRRYA